MGLLGLLCLPGVFPAILGSGCVDLANGKQYDRCIGTVSACHPLTGSRTPGQTCATGADCQSKYCVDGVCCQTACTGTCVACNVGSAPGTCTSIPAGQDPTSECKQDDAATCRQDGACDGQGGCRLYLAGTVCSPQTCVAAVETARTCDGSGTCRDATVRPCAGYKCNGTTCGTTCSGDGDCDLGAACSAGACMIPSCSNGKKDGSESDVDCGGTTCAQCPRGGACAVDGDCKTAFCSGAKCAIDAPTCKALLAADPTLPTGVYKVDLDGKAGAGAPFSVYCDMVTAGGGWTRVAFEAAGAGNALDGALSYLGIERGTPDGIAMGTAAGVIGTRFSRSYGEVAITWGANSIRFSIAEDLFVNAVNATIPISNVMTSDTTLAGWITTAGGALFCRASRSQDIRPGDTGWAVKPSDSREADCGCNNMSWVGRGAFYGGFRTPTSCMGWGGGWAGVKATAVQKGGVISTADLSLWVR
jgi:hypothetical protein